MHVQMKNRLARSRSHIQHCSISILNPALARNICRSHMTEPDDLRIRGRCLFQTANMFLGNDKHMRRSLRIDVLKRECMLVFINLFGRNLTSNDPAK